VSAWLTENGQGKNNCINLGRKITWKRIAFINLDCPMKYFFWSSMLAPFEGRLVGATVDQQKICSIEVNSTEDLLN